MTVGTKSVLFGAHAIYLHPFFLGAAWVRLYGVPWDPRMWAAFLFHDIGYWGKPNMDGPEGERHVELGARILGRLCGPSWAEFSLCHSRHWARKHGCEVSQLCAADKLAFAMTPWWLYLPMTKATGELAEYMALSQERQAGDHTFTASERALLATGHARSWLRGLQSYTRRWVDQHQDCCLSVDEISAQRELAASAL